LLCNNVLHFLFLFYSFQNLLLFLFWWCFGWLFLKNRRVWLCYLVIWLVLYLFFFLLESLPIHFCLFHSLIVSAVVLLFCVSLWGSFIEWWISVILVFAAVCVVIARISAFTFIRTTALLKDCMWQDSCCNDVSNSPQEYVVFMLHVYSFCMRVYTRVSGLSW